MPQPAKSSPPAALATPAPKKARKSLRLVADSNGYSDARGDIWSEGTKCGYMYTAATTPMTSGCCLSPIITTL